MRSLLTIFVGLLPSLAMAAPLRWEANEKSRSWTLHRGEGDSPLLVVVLPKDGRPYFHPLLAPDGNGILTEYSPAHHKHQTGLYVGFLQVNGRDFFHNRGKDHFRSDDSPGFITEDDQPIATALFKSTWLDADGSPLLIETQDWTIRDKKTHYLLDLTWTGRAEKDITFGKYDYGGLFLRMPWRPKTGGTAVNSAGEENAKAEGRPAAWVDVGMPIVGRKDAGHIAILAHKDNPGGPTRWRVDGQLGVGPATSRAGAWKIERGKTVQLRYRLVVYTGPLNKPLLESLYRDFVASR